MQGKSTRGESLYKLDLIILSPHQHSFLFSMLRFQSFAVPLPVPQGWEAARGEKTIRQKKSSSGGRGVLLVKTVDE